MFLLIPKEHIKPMHLCRGKSNIDFDLERARFNPLIANIYSQTFEVPISPLGAVGLRVTKSQFIILSRCDKVH